MSISLSDHENRIQVLENKISSSSGQIAYYSKTGNSSSHKNVGITSETSSASVLVCQIAGLYYMEGRSYEGHSGGQYIKVNGTNLSSGSGYGGSTGTASIVYELNVGDTIEIYSNRLDAYAGRILAKISLRYFSIIKAHFNHFLEHIKEVLL